jgi:hypothetical protein
MSGICPSDMSTDCRERMSRGAEGNQAVEGPGVHPSRGSAPTAIRRATAGRRTGSRRPGHLRDPPAPGGGRATRAVHSEQPAGANALADILHPAACGESGAEWRWGKARRRRSGGLQRGGGRRRGPAAAARRRRGRSGPARCDARSGPVAHFSHGMSRLDAIMVAWEPRC